MGSIYTFILCSLLLQIDGTRLPDARQVPFVPTVPSAQVQTAPIAEPPAAVPQTNIKQARFANGMSMPPRHSHVILSAPERAGELLSLSTERRDAAGNIVTDSDGNPIIVPITLGMNVFRGQVLGKFDDRDLLSTLRINDAQLEVAKAERDKKLEVEDAARSVQVAEAEYRARVQANRQHAGTVTEMELLQVQLAVLKAWSYLDLQKYIIEEVKTRDVTVRESELERTKVQIELRQLVTKIDGMVVKINAAEGEWYREGQEILEIMRLDTLWVVVQASVDEYEISDLSGKQAIASAAFPNGRTETFQGTVVFCDPKVLAGEKFEVYVEVQNRRIGNYWLLQPGRTNVEVVIAL